MSSKQARHPTTRTRRRSKAQSLPSVGVPGTEHLQHHEPEPQAPTESHINGWDDGLATHNAG